MSFCLLSVFLDVASDWRIVANILSQSEPKSLARVGVKMINRLVLLVVVFLVIVIYSLMRLPIVENSVIPNTAEAIEYGEYLVSAGGCVSCHESPNGESSFSGGLSLESPFGTFYVPNITPDKKTGIGAWDGADFIRALKHGRSPNGGYYFPAFPYLSYEGVSNQDVLNIAAYLKSLPPVEAQSHEHDLPMWLIRPLMAGWNIIARFLLTAIEIDPNGLGDDETVVLARGEYLGRHLGHCGECHTPRNSLGMMKGEEEFAGASVGEDNVEAIDPEALSGWSEEDFAFFLLLGLKPDGDYVGGEMESVIEHNTSKLTDVDRRALASFFKRGVAR